MTEILVDADFGHPPERVWRALTDRRVLSDWLMRTDFEPREGGRFELVPEGLPGFSGVLEGELIELAPPRRMVTLWRGEQLHCRVVWELEPIPGGCRLRTSHTGFLGVKGSLRRKELQRTYERLLTQRLPTALARLATSEGDLVPAGSVSVVAKASGDLRWVAPTESRAPAPDTGDAPAAQRARPGVLPWLPHRRRGQLLAAAGALVLAVLTAALLSSLGAPTFSPSVGGAPEDRPLDPPVVDQESRGVPVPGPGGSSAPVGGGPGGGGPGGGGPVSGGPVGDGPVGDGPAQGGPDGPVNGGAFPPPAPGPPPAGPPPAPPGGASGTFWRAAYRTANANPAGYRGDIRVTNTGTTAQGSWEVVVTLREGQQIAQARKAAFEQVGTTVTFTPLRANRLVRPGKSITFGFMVKTDSDPGPVACVIDGRACTGV